MENEGFKKGTRSRLCPEWLKNILCLLIVGSFSSWFVLIALIFFLTLSSHIVAVIFSVLVTWRVDASFVSSLAWALAVFQALGCSILTFYLSCSLLIKNLYKRVFLTHLFLLFIELIILWRLVSDATYIGKAFPILVFTEHKLLSLNSEPSFQLFNMSVTEMTALFNQSLLLVLALHIVVLCYLYVVREKTSSIWQSLIALLILSLVFMSQHMAMQYVSYTVEKEVAKEKKMVKAVIGTQS